MVVAVVLVVVVTVVAIVAVVVAAVVVELESTKSVVESGPAISRKNYTQMYGTRRLISGEQSFRIKGSNSAILLAVSRLSALESRGAKFDFENFSRSIKILQPLL